MFASEIYVQKEKSGATAPVFHPATPIRATVRVRSVLQQRPKLTAASAKRVSSRQAETGVQIRANGLIAQTISIQTENALYLTQTTTPADAKRDFSGTERLASVRAKEAVHAPANSIQTGNARQRASRPFHADAMRDTGGGTTPRPARTKNRFIWATSAQDRTNVSATRKKSPAPLPAKIFTVRMRSMPLTDSAKRKVSRFLPETAIKSSSTTPQACNGSRLSRQPE